jgi:hypothetical protein
MTSSTKLTGGCAVRVYVCGGCNRVHISVGFLDFSIDEATFSLLHEKMTALMRHAKPNIDSGLHMNHEKRKPH